MALTFVGIDPNTGDGECPTVWVDRDAEEIIIQGWKVDETTRAECLQTGPIPETEAVVRIPARMAPILREACDAVERAELR
ncbi:hypothetical protein ABZ547_13350 [Streptomyces sparsogenes]|uniref:hypothetical protein n=1 Tax=Streptomyces sparsogenes TaxID=67365 RepID=UPI0033D2D811